MKPYASRAIVFPALLLAVLTVSWSRAEDAGDATLDADKKALEPLKTYVGQWKGASKATDPSGGFAEDSDWSWEFKDGHAAIVFATPKGKFFSAGKIVPGEKPGTYKFDGTLPDGKAHQEFSGEMNKTELVLDTAAPADAGRPNHLSIEMVAKGKRMIVYYQKKTGERLAPLAEVGFTRQGSGFGKETNDHECVITGGLGTIPVSYKGQTYYVCCGGCKTSFNENPEKELAAFKKRKEEEAKAAK